MVALAALAELRSALTTLNPSAQSGDLERTSQCTNT
jgi:hypothetical protein